MSLHCYMRSIPTLYVQIYTCILKVYVTSYPISRHNRAHSYTLTLQVLITECITCGNTHYVVIWYTGWFVFPCIHWYRDKSWKELTECQCYIYKLWFNLPCWLYRKLQETRTLTFRHIFLEGSAPEVTIDRLYQLLNFSHNLLASAPFAT